MAIVKAMVPSTLGERLRWARGIADISARELDRLAGKNEGHAAAVETKFHDRASVSTIVDYADVLGISLEWLVTGEGPAPSRAAVCIAVEAAQRRTEAANRSPAPTRRTRRAHVA